MRNVESPNLGVPFEGVVGRFHPHSAEDTGLPVVGGIPIHSTPAIPFEEYQRNYEINLRRALPRVRLEEPHSKSVAIVGSGPSCDIGLIEEDVIFSLNGSHDWLLDQGIVPDAMVVLDAQEEPMLRFLNRPHQRVTYYVASCVNPKCFDALEGFHVVMWNPCIAPYLLTDYPNEAWIGPRTTALLSSLPLSFCLGFRKAVLHGSDSCFKGGQTHSDRIEPLKDPVVTAFEGDRYFNAVPQWVLQVSDAVQCIPMYQNRGMEIKVTGDGLMQHTLKTRGIV